MRTTVVGVVHDELGHARDGLRCWATPSASIAAVQDPRLLVDRDHDHRAVGEVLHLEVDAQSRLWAVAEVEQDAVDASVYVKVGQEVVRLASPLYWSSETIGDDAGRRRLRWLSLTTCPARVAAQPVTFLDGDVHGGSAARWGLRGQTRDLIQHAATARVERHRGDPIVVAGTRPQPAALETRGARIELRSAAAVADVNTVLREVDLIISPAECPTVIHERGRSYTEVIAHGAFRAAEAAPHRCLVNVHHDPARVVGRAVSLDAWHEQGLAGTIKLSRTSDADDCLGLIADGILGVSAGFWVAPSGEQWLDGGKTRRIREASLDHIALTGSPAYPGAVVTAVRSDRLLAR